MNGFIECRHPDLPADQTAFFKVPRNGWVPIDEDQPKPKRRKTKTSSGRPASRADEPNAGESNDNTERTQS